jgi:hypothetical protein
VINATAAIKEQTAPIRKAGTLSVRSIQRHQAPTPKARSVETEMKIM